MGWGAEPSAAPPAAELTSRGFVRGLEAASTNGQRSDLVRAVLVRPWPLGGLCGWLGAGTLPGPRTRPLPPAATDQHPPLPAPGPGQACGFYPQVGRLLPRPQNDGKARTTVLTRRDERVRIHPASVNAK